MATTHDRPAIGPRRQPRIRPARGVRNWVRQGWTWLIGSWAVRGFREAEAANLAAIIAFNAMIVLVPAALLLATMLGLVIRQDDALLFISRVAFWALPARDAREALDAALEARRYSGWLGLISLAAFLWIGTGFVNALSHCFNRIYGAPDCGFVCSRRRGFVVVVLFALLFSVAAIAATLPTLFIGRHLNPFFQTWVLAQTRGKVAGYAIAVVAAIALFGVLYRAVPTAGQSWRDVWLGAIVAGGLFVLLGQMFPLYLRFAGGVNRYGAALGLVWLLVTWFAAMAHVLLFGCFVNASHQRWRQQRQQRGE